LYAALAEKERSLIATRTTAGLKAAKRRGTKLGMKGKTDAEAKAIQVRGAEANKEAALARVETLRPHIEFALKGARHFGRQSKPLNARGIQSPRGGRWHAPSLLKAAKRLGLR
jgi:DNA invertase Pin-like site-specific DNA recombinase